MKNLSDKEFVMILASAFKQKGDIDTVVNGIIEAQKVKGLIRMYPATLFTANEIASMKVAVMRRVVELRSKGVKIPSLR